MLASGRRQAGMESWKRHVGKCNIIVISSQRRSTRRFQGWDHSAAVVLVPKQGHRNTHTESHLRNCSAHAASPISHHIVFKHHHQRGQPLLGHVHWGECGSSHASLQHISRCSWKQQGCCWPSCCWCKLVIALMGACSA